MKYDNYSMQTAFQLDGKLLTYQLQSNNENIEIGSSGPKHIYKEEK